MNTKGIENEESETLEFKKSTAQLEKALKSICGFLNHKGGKVYFGIDKTGKVVGQEISDKTLKSISQKIRQKIKPEVSLEIKVLKIEGKDIIKVGVKEGTNKPYYLDGVAYKRIGTESPVISPEELERIILEKKKKYFDSEICEEATLENIDEEKVRWFLETAKVERSYPLSENISVRDTLIHLKLLKDGKLINAAILLFGKNPQKIFLQAEVKCLHFHGTEVEKPFETYHIYGSNIFQQIDNSRDFVLDRMKRPVILESGKATTMRPYEIPEFVIREAIVNAIAHRDYYSDAGVQIMVFVDRIEIWNPGGLPKQLKIADLRKPHPSIPRNSLITESFYLTNYIEKAGSGTLEMIKQCRNAGLAEPNFEQKMGCFVTTVWRSILTDEYLKSLGLNERQKKSIKYIEKHSKITRAEYEKLNNVSERTANRELNNLVNRKLIEKRGKGPRTHYVLARYGEIWRDKMIRLKGDKHK